MATSGKGIAGVFDKLLTAVTVLCLFYIGYLAARPGGVARKAYDEWRLSRARRSIIQASWSEMEAEAGRLNATGGKVIAFEFSDYECPYCRNAFAKLDSLLSQHDGIDIGYINFPLSIHAAAEGAAKASIYALSQGKFQQMHRRLFTTTRWQVDQDWVREALAAGIADTSSFSRCLSSVTTLKRLENEKELGQRLAISGTPSFVTSSTVISGLDVGEILKDQ